MVLKRRVLRLPTDLTSGGTSSTNDPFICCPPVVEQEHGRKIMGESLWSLKQNCESQTPTTAESAKKRKFPSIGDDSQLRGVMWTNCWCQTNGLRLSPTRSTYPRAKPVQTKAIRFLTGRNRAVYEHGENCSESPNMEARTKRNKKETLDPGEGSDHLYLFLTNFKQSGETNSICTVSLLF